MSEHNLNHQKYLSAVAAEDVRFTIEKDTSYNGSWKLRGGVGAFMMMARKWDRLEMLLKSAWKYDIFTAIEQQTKIATEQGCDPGGDGLVLAEVRDLRRYLGLVEAEMMSRGVVAKPHIPPVQIESGAPKGGDGRDGVFIAVGDWCVWTRPSDGADIMAKLMDVSKDGALIDAGQDTEEWTGTPWRFLKKNPERSVPRFAGPKVPGPMKEALVSHASMVRPPVHRLPEYEPGTPEDGGHHAQQPADESQLVGDQFAPWVTTTGFFMRKGVTQDMIDTFWKRQAPGIYVLEPYVVSEQIPRVLQNFYNLRDTKWVLRIDKCPQEVRDHFPDLQNEKNMKEWEELPPWQRALYKWDVNSKNVLSEHNAAWHVEGE